MSNAEYCVRLVRGADRDRYVANLLAPPQARPHLFALHAFNVEIESVAGRVQETIAGEIRLQWWRDMLHGRAEGAAAHPVAAVLAETIAAKALPPDDLAALVDAHLFDLYDESMPSLAGLEAYARATDGALFHLAGRVLAAHDAPDDLQAAAARAGMAVRLARILTALPRSVPAGRSFLPADSAARHRLDLMQAGEPAQREKLSLVIREIAQAAHRHLARAEKEVADLPRDARMAFPTLALVAPSLARVEAARNPLVHQPLSPFRRTWLIWRAARRLGRRA